MLEMGIIVGIGLLATLVKMSWAWRIRMLSNPLIVDIAVFTLLTFLHWGTFSGVMVATIGALTCSLTLSIGRWLFGYKVKGVYQPGKFNIAAALGSGVVAKS